MPQIFVKDCPTCQAQKKIEQMDIEQQIRKHPLGKDLEALIDSVIEKRKVGKTRFLQMLLTQYTVKKKVKAKKYKEQKDA